MDAQTIEKRAERIRWGLMALTGLSLLLITVPTLFVIFYKIPVIAFRILNTSGVILAGVRIIISGAMTTTAIGTKSETTDFKKSLDKEAKYLLVLVILIQLFNLAFIHV